MTTLTHVRSVAQTLAGSEERETWHRPTFRVGDQIYAAVHDDLLILRETKEAQSGRLAADPRLQPAPYWGRNGWVAVELAEISDAEAGALLRESHGLLEDAG